MDYQCVSLSKDAILNPYCKRNCTTQGLIPEYGLMGLTCK
jgi:hypothetical protein